MGDQPIFSPLRLIHTAGDELGYRLEFLSYTEVGSRDPSPSLYNVNMLHSTM